MRLAFIRQTWRPDGGAERILARTLAVLDGRDVEPVVIARNWPGRMPGRSEVAVIADPGNYRSRVSRLADFARFACGVVAREGFDLVQSHERLPCCDVYRAGDGVHAEWLQQRARFQGPGARWAMRHSRFHRAVLAAERALFRSERLKAVICNSAMVRDEINRHFGFPRERMHVIYNGVDGDVFSPDTRAARQDVFERVGVPGKPFVFLFVGSGFERKGLDTALRALARVSAHGILLVIGTDKRLARYRSLARKLGVESRVWFLGKKKEVSTYYGAADALLLPTWYDPFPNACTEAFACGLPVITSHQCGAAELIRDGENGHVADAADVAAFAEHMTAAMDHGPGYYTDAAVDTVKDFTLNKMVDEMMTLYDALRRRP